MASVIERFAGLSRVVTIVVVLLLVAGAVFVFVDRTEDRTLTVDFPRTNSLYEGSDVKILGVAVGTVDSLEPRGKTVRAKISYPRDIALPDDVKAVIVSPAVVGDRFVQLAPAYEGGAKLANNATLGPDRTEVPVELDEVYGSLNDLSVALGPDGANKEGALSRLVDDSATQLDGQGAQLNLTLRNFGKLSQTLADNKDDLFGSVREIAEFIEMLNRNDKSVRAFFDSTAEVSGVLEGERKDLAATIKALGEALVEVRKLVRENRGELRGNVKNLKVITRVLAENEKNLSDVTVSAPTALSNLTLTYNSEYGTLDNHADVLSLLTGTVNDPKIVCDLARNLLQIPDPLTGRCNDLAGVLGGMLGAARPGSGAPAKSGGPKSDAPPKSGSTAEGEEISPELMKDLRKGLGAERTKVTSSSSPSQRTQTSLAEMLGAQ